MVYGTVPGTIGGLDLVRVPSVGPKEQHPVEDGRYVRHLVRTFGEYSVEH